MKKLLFAMTLLSIASLQNVRAWEFPTNPDRYASIGIHKTETWQNGARDEIDYNSGGYPLNTGGHETMTTSELGLDLRIPVHANCTLEGGYWMLDTYDHFVREAALHKETRDLSGYKATIGVRFYLK